MRRQLFICFVAILLFIGSSLAANHNLLENSGFENQLAPWRLYGSGAGHKIDQNEKNSGRSSLMLESVDSQAYVIQRVPIRGDQLYYLSFWAKTDNIPVLSGGDLFTKVEWRDRNKICGEESMYFTNFVVSGRWIKYTCTFLAPSDAIDVDLFLRVRGKGALAWFDDVYFGLQKEPNLEKMEVFLSPWAFKGSVAFQIKYTPEDLWEAGTRIQLYSDIAFTGDTKLYLNLGGWLPRDDEFISFATLGSIASQFKIKRAYIQTDAEILKGFPKFRATIGDVDVAYNPYIIKLDRFDLTYWDAADDLDDPVSYNRNLRGLTFDQIDKKPLMQDAFIVWDNDKDKYVYGGRTRLSVDTKNISFIYTNYLDNTNANGEPNEKDFTYGIDTNLTFGELNVYGLVAKQQKTLLGVAKKVANCVVFNLDYAMNSQSKVSFKKWELDPLFLPRYRDKTPNVDPYTGERLQLNPITRYGGKNGYGFYFTAAIPGFKLRLENEKSSVIESGNSVDNYRCEVVTELGNLKTKSIFEHEKLDRLNEFNLLNRVQINSFACSASYILKENNNFRSSIVGSYYKYNFNEEWLDKYETIFVTKLKSGVFQNGEIFFGPQVFLKANGHGQRSFVTGISLKLASSLNFIVRNSSPNVVEPRDVFKDKALLYDDFGLPFSKDNIISLDIELQI